MSKRAFILKTEIYSINENLCPQMSMKPLNIPYTMAPMLPLKLKMWEFCAF